MTLNINLKKAVVWRFIAQPLDSSSYMKIYLITRRVTAKIFITPSKSICCTLNSYPTAFFRINEESGFALIMVLMFLLLLTMLNMVIMRKALLETKMSRNFQYATLSLLLAENNLTKKERAIRELKSLPVGVKEFAQLASGQAFYEINSSGIYHGVETRLRSYFSIWDNHHQRTSWKVVAFK